MVSGFDMAGFSMFKVASEDPGLEAGSVWQLAL